MKLVESPNLKLVVNQDTVPARSAIETCKAFGITEQSIAEIPESLVTATVEYATNMFGDALEVYFSDSRTTDLLPEEVPQLLDELLTVVSGERSPVDAVNEIIGSLTTKKNEATFYSIATVSLLNTLIPTMRMKAIDSVLTIESKYKAQDVHAYKDSKVTLEAFGFALPQLKTSAPVIADAQTERPERIRERFGATNTKRLVAAAALTAALSSLVVNPAAAEDSPNSIPTSTIASAQTFEAQLTVDAINPLTGEEVQITANSVQTAKENTAEARNVIETLTPEFQEGLSRLDKVVKSGDLNDMSGSDADVYAIEDPAHPKKRLQLTMSDELKANIAAKVDLLHGILANDQEVIDILTQYFTDNPISEEDEKLIRLVRGISFSEQGEQDLTETQKTLFLIIMRDTSELASRSANEQYNAAKKAFEAQQKEEEKVEGSTKSKANKYDKYIAEVLATPKFEGLEQFELSRADIAVIESQDFSQKQKDFIKKVYPLLIKYQDKYKYNALVLMSMVVQENNINPDNDLFKVAHNIFSIKAPRDYDGPIFEAPTWEQYDGSGEITEIDNARWIKFESDEACIEYFVSHTLGLSAYDDSRKFYKSPELFLMGLLNKMQSDGDVEKAHHLGAIAYATALEYAYGVPAIAAQRGFSKIGPENYRVGYTWDAKTTDGHFIPTQLRGSAFYHVDSARYASHIGANSVATHYDSVAMVLSQFSNKNINPVEVKELSSGARSLPEIIKPISRKGLSYRTIKLSSDSFADVLKTGAAQIIVEGNKGSYVLDMTTVGKDKQGFFVLDPTSTKTSTEPWSYAELKHKLGIKKAYAVGSNVYGEKPKAVKAQTKPTTSSWKGSYGHSNISQFPATLPDGTPYLSQWDNVIADKPYPKSNGDYRTMKTSGCSPTTGAWVLRDSGKNPNASPLQIAHENLKNGGRDSSREAFREFAKKYDFKFLDISGYSTEEQVRLIVEARKINPETNRPYGSVVASGMDSSASDPAPFTSSGHVLGIYKVRKDGKVKVMDPNSLKKSKQWWSKEQIIARASYVYILYPR